MLLPDELTPGNFVSSREHESTVHSTIPGWIYRFFSGMPEDDLNMLIESAVGATGFEPFEGCCSDDAFAGLTPEESCSIWYNHVLSLARSNREWSV
jgi:hypothetical protein